VERICQSRLLEPVLEKELMDTFGTRLTEPKELLNYLTQRGGLTDYQIQQIGANQGLSLRIGNYIVLGPLGDARRGLLFKARLINTTEQVAFKIVRPPRPAGADAEKKFTSTINALKRFVHPNVTRIHDGGIDRGGYFVATELIEGTDLGERVSKDGPLRISLACTYIRQTALALEYAYENCLTHGDIKPANLLVTSTESENDQPEESRVGMIKLIGWGWGVLRSVSAAAGGSKSAGTAEYTAPEQMHDPFSADIRADIYSLGCTLYFLLTGRPPFSGDASVDPTPIRELQSSVPPALDEVIKKMMLRRPADRYRSPAGVAVALLPFCNETKR
jgi:serine/threonine-protein kinase